MSKLVEVGQFYKVAKDDFKEEFGIGKGVVVLAVGEGLFPISETDPYLRRVYFAITPFDNGTLDLNEKPIVVAAESLEFLSDKEQEDLQAMLKVFEESLPQ